MLTTRGCVHREGTLTTSASTSPELDISNYSSGEIFIPAASSITTLTYHVSSATGGTYYPAYDSAGSAVTQTVAASRGYAMPSSVFGAPAIRIVVNANGAVAITLKS